jgi:hypothetical protein
MPLGQSTPVTLSRDRCRRLSLAARQLRSNFRRGQCLRAVRAKPESEIRAAGLRRPGVVRHTCSGRAIGAPGPAKISRPGGPQLGGHGAAHVRRGTRHRPAIARSLRRFSVSDWWCFSRDCTEVDKFVLRVADCANIVRLASGPLAVTNRGNCDYCRNIPARSSSSTIGRGTCFGSGFRCAIDPAVDSSPDECRSC